MDKSVSQLTCEKIHGEAKAAKLHNALLEGEVIELIVMGDRVKVWREDGDHPQGRLSNRTGHPFNVYCAHRVIHHVEARGGSYQSDSLWNADYLPEFLWFSIAALSIKDPEKMYNVDKDGCISIFPQEGLIGVSNNPHTKNYMHVFTEMANNRRKGQHVWRTR